MAMCSNPVIEENQALKLNGDLGDIEILDNGKETEDEEYRGGSSRTVDTLSTLHRDIVKPTVPVFGSVRVTKSENVHFGNNTYFNGPVTIKQVVHNNEHDNPGYEHTEDTIPGNAAAPQKTYADATKDDPQIKPWQLQLWLKMTFAAVCVILAGVICVIVSVNLVYTNQDDTTSSNNNEEDSTKCLKVEGLYHIYRNLKIIGVSMALVLLIYIWCHNLLTKEMYGGDNMAISVSVKQTTVTESNDKYNVEADPLLIAPTHLRIVSKTDWLAQPVEKPLDKIRLPVPWVIIQHTATESCHMQSECVLRVRLIQMFHVESRGWYDIGYNFLVAGDGSAYMGRGWDFQGAHTLGYNKYSMGIAFIGTFNNEAPPKKQLDACKKLIQRGVELGKIAKDYKIFAHRQLASTLSPGDKLFEIMKEWPHFVNNFTDIKDLLPDY